MLTFFIVVLMLILDHNEVIRRMFNGGAFVAGMIGIIELCVWLGFYYYNCV